MHAPARSATPTRRGARAVPSQIDSLSFVLELLPLVEDFVLAVEDCPGAVSLFPRHRIHEK